MLVSSVSCDTSNHMAEVFRERHTHELRKNKMRCMFALALVLHFCSCAGSRINFNLNVEMIERLDMLTKLYRGKQLNFTSPDTVKIPSIEMHNNVLFCMDVFKRELRLLLNTVSVKSVKNESAHIVTELKANLDQMKTNVPQKEKCKMENGKGSLSPFKPYVTFLKKLNARAW
ncbi:uncharacterized protein LOC144082553 [Stigmatopora argus]